MNIYYYYVEINRDANNFFFENSTSNIHYQYTNTAIVKIDLLVNNGTSIYQHRLRNNNFKFFNSLLWSKRTEIIINNLKNYILKFNKTNITNSFKNATKIKVLRLNRIYSLFSETTDK